MADRARIAVGVDGGYFKSVYLHDGYGVLPVLSSYYGSHPNALGLLELGDLSRVRIFPGDVDPVPGHSFANPKPNFTVAYHRDRGEALRPAKLSNWNGLLELCCESDADYLYYLPEGSSSWSMMKRCNW